jgi:hypothetical protein
MQADKSLISIDFNKIGDRRNIANVYTTEELRNELIKRGYTPPIDASRKKLIDELHLITERPGRIPSPTRRILSSPPPKNVTSEFPRNILSVRANTTSYHKGTPSLSKSILHTKVTKKRALVRLIPGSGKADILYWLFSGSSAELELLDSEVDKYNYWIINILGAGLAPLSSYNEDYISGNVLNTMLVASDNKYKPFLSTYSKNYPVDSLEFIYIDEQDKNPENDMGTIVADFLADEITLKDFNILEKIIQTPWVPGLEFTMGYRVLPIFRRLIDKQNK